MDPSALTTLHVALLVFLWLTRAVVVRVAELLWTGVTLAVFGGGYLYASVAVHLGKFVGRSESPR